MNKLSWQLLEWWATRKYEKYGKEEFLDLVMFCVAEKAKLEHKIGRSGDTTS